MCTLPPKPVKKSVITHHAFEESVVELVAASLGSVASGAPFELPGAAVYQIEVPNTAGQAATKLTLWPSLSRVDAISPSSTVVFTDVRTVDIVGEVEVQFRRQNRNVLIVARGGKVIVRA